MDQASSNKLIDFNGNSPKKFVDHEVITDDGRVFYRCIYCNKLFPIKTSRTWHMKKCKAKEYIFTVAEDYEEKQQNKLETPPKKKIDIKQNIVLVKPAENKSEDEEEEDEVEEGWETKCSQCKKEFRTSIELLRHVRSKHTYPKVVMAMSEVKKFYDHKDRSKCPICLKPLKNQFRCSYIKHLHTHTNEMKYACNVCSQRFRRLDHMKAHEKRHVKS